MLLMNRPRPLRGCAWLAMGLRVSLGFVGVFWAPVSPRRHSVVIAFTGASGRQHGYADDWAADGVYRYFGEGQSGDMRWKGGNVAIRDHAANGEDLLLFQKLGDGSVRFLCEFVCAGYDLELAPDGTGVMRQAIVFNLVPGPDLDEDATPVSSENSGTTDLQTLRRRALEAVSTPTQADHSRAKRNVYERSREIRAYVLARAKGHCEACLHPAPFIANGGNPYLEPRHIRRLGDGGPDDPRFMAALCPNCHRQIHHGADSRRMNERLQVTVSTKEAALEPKLSMPRSLG
jgi:5-methylcytosine-specific restriction enzyme A